MLDSETIKKVMDGKTKMYFCERHFQGDDIELSFIRGDGKNRQLKLQVLPSREFPKKSIERSSAIERRPLIRKVAEEAPQKVHVYRDFSELCKRVQTLRFSWKLEIGTEVKLKKITRPYIVPEFEIIISDSLQFTVAVHGWLLPSDHPLYKANSRSMYGVSVSALINEIASYVMCPGLSLHCGEVKRHTLPCEIDIQKEQSTNPTKELCRHKNCVILMNSGDSLACQKCMKYLQKREKQRLQKVKPVHMFALLSQVSKVRLVETVKHLTSEQRIKIKNKTRSE